MIPTFTSKKHHGFGIMNAFSRLLFADVSIVESAAAFTAPAHATLQFTVGIPGKRALPALTTAPATPTRLRRHRHSVNEL
jgi:hypothetical protein